MMKNSLPLWIIGVSLIIILIFIPIQEAYAEADITYTAQTTTTTTITLTWSENVNGAGASTGDWTISTGQVVTSVTHVDGTNTSTLNLDTALEVDATPTVTYAENGHISDTATGLDTPVVGGVVATDGIPAISSTNGRIRIPPSYSTAFAENEYPISIGDTKFKQSQLAFAVPTTVIEIGKSIPVNLLIYDEDGPSYIFEVALYTNLNGIFRGVSNSDTSIIYKRGNPLEILDPNGFFSEVVFTSSEVNQKLQISYEITFAKEMEKSDIIVQAKDIGNSVGVLTVIDAWQVIQASTVVETTETPTDEPIDDSVPGEIKVKTLNVEKPAYYMREEILFFGTVDGYKFGSAVTIIIRNPSNNFLTLISTFPDKDGYYETKIKTDSKFKTDGTYSATAFADDPNRGTRAIFYFSRDAPPPPPVTTSPVQSTQTEPTATFEPVIQSEPVTPKPKPRPSFVDLDKDPQSYVDRYNTEPTYKNWFDSNFPDYTIYEAVGLAEPAKEKVPGWIKNNAKWWSEGQIDDGTFVSGIQFLMTKKIIDIPDLPEQASEKTRPTFVDPQKDPQSYIDRYNNEVSYKEWFDENYPDYTIEEAVGIPEPIPGWIKNNAKWWADGQISEDDFVGGIEWLVEQGIIKI